MIYLARVTAAIDDAGTTTVLLFGSQDWTTATTDTPANTAVRGRLIEPGNYRREMSRGNTLFGYVQGGYGVAKVALHGGSLDAMRRYGFGWRAYDLFAAPSADPYAALPAFPGGWAQVLAAVVDSVGVEAGPGGETLSFALRDTMAKLDRPVCALYAGTGGAEGPAALAGQPKPRLYGSVCNVRPVLLDASNLIYQVSDKPYVQPRHVYDKRSAYTPTSNNVNDAADFAALQAMSVAGSSFARLSDAGMLKLGSTSTLPTVDAMRHDAAYSTGFGRPRLGEVVADIAADAGLAGTEIAAALTGIDSGGGASLGAYVVDTGTTYAQLLGSMAASRGAWIGCDRLGVLTGGVLAAPSGSPAWDFTGEAAQAVAIASGPYAGAPAKAVTVRGGYNWTPLSGADVAGVSSATADAIAREFTYTERGANSVGTKHLNAPEAVVDTQCGPVTLVAPALPGAAVGITPAAWLALHGVERDFVEITVHMSAALLTAVDLGATVRLTWGRMGYESGKLMMVAGMRMSFAAERITYVLWG